MNQEKIALKAAADLLHQYWTESGQDDFSYDDLDDEQWLEIIKVYSEEQSCETVKEDIIEALGHQPNNMVKLFIKTVYDRSNDAQVVKSLSEMLVEYNKDYLSDHIQGIFQDRVERDRDQEE